MATEAGTLVMIRLRHAISKYLLWLTCSFNFGLIKAMQIALKAFLCLLNTGQINNNKIIKAMLQVILETFSWF